MLVIFYFFLDFLVIFLDVVVIIIVFGLKLGRVYINVNLIMVSFLFRCFKIVLYLVFIKNLDLSGLGLKILLIYLDVLN